ncbi:helix-turn-helix domain-containing protein [Brevundimonas sp. TWP2-3-4b1]|uniref:helix-turn-helix domain-containing protein n=1 Tax=Brevundimonas sp. TWP2-3-4b1 TaxID=2804580 RepID=UPI003CF469A4
MARFASDPDAAALGEGLATLRRAVGLSQAEAGARIGMTSQGWGLYESGKRPGLFRPDVQRRLTGALNATPEDLALILAREGPATAPPATGVESLGRAFSPPPERHANATERMQLSNDDLAPWAASGVVLEFDPGRWPRRDQGCVIDLADGTRLVRLYQSADGDRLYVKGGPAGLGAETSLDRNAVARVAAVRARLDE